MKKVAHILGILAWLCLSILGYLCNILNICDYWLWALMGFCVPTYSRYMVVASAGVNDLVGLGLLYAIIGFLFLAAVVASLILLFKKSKLFYYLVILDPILVFSEFLLYAIVSHGDFDAWWVCLQLFVKFALLHGLYLFYIKKQREHGNVKEVSE